MKPRHRQGARQAGAALLLAMIIVTLVSTVAAGMVWQQTRAVNIEAAERQRVQMGALSNAGMNFARGAVRQLLSRGVTAERVKQLLANPVARTELRKMLAVDRNNTDDGLIQAWIAIRGEDASARYNLRALVDAEGKLVPTEVTALQRLCSAAGLTGVAEQLAPALRAAWGQPQEGSNVPAVLAPRRVADLAWFGLDESTLKQLARFIEILPDGQVAPVNINTAPKEVIYAVIDNLSMTAAADLERGDTKPVFKDPSEFQTLLPENARADPQRVAVVSRHFYAHLELEYEGLLLQETYLVAYGGPSGADAKVLRRERSFSKALTP